MATTMAHDQPVVLVTTGTGHQFELIRAEAENPLATLLWLPGMGISAQHYIPVARALSGHGLEVYIHEWRGNGSSNLRARRDINWGYRELLLEDLAAAIAAVRSRTGNDGVILGGHSLGAQFACLAAALQPGTCTALVITAGGTPYWRAYPMPMKLALPAAFAAFSLITSLAGYYPGKRLGFAGNEARGVISDWVRTGRTGRYHLPEIETDLEAAMARLAVPVLALWMADDRFVPHGPVDWLTSKLSGCEVAIEVLNSDDLGGRADHYRWMNQPEILAARIAMFARP